MKKEIPLPLRQLPAHAAFCTTISGVRQHELEASFPGLPLKGNPSLRCFRDKKFGQPRFAVTAVALTIFGVGGTGSHMMNTGFLNDEDDLIRRATAAYFRRGAAEGAVYQQPNQGYSRVENDVVILENIRGELARYKILTAKNGMTRLRWLDL